mmetsp:Transcript_19184/g.53295  ORF Transcript_19184/g.53295 Transcript_19184/m.53295 type:complete len:215 (+) Transcript_19184:1037-1681(+)
MSKTRDERVSAVLLKARSIFRHDSRERLQVSLANSLRDTKVRSQLCFHAFGEEKMPIRDLAHQQLHHNQQALHFDAESQPCVAGRLPQRLGEAGECFGVLESQRVDSAAVVQVTAELIVRRGVGEGRIRQELVRLFDLVMQQVVPQHEIQQRRLGVDITTKTGHVVSLDQVLSEIGGKTGVIEQFRHQRPVSVQPGKSWEQRVRGESVLGGQLA